MEAEELESKGPTILEEIEYMFGGIDSQNTNGNDNPTNNKLYQNSTKGRKLDL